MFSKLSSVIFMIGITVPAFAAQGPGSSGGGRGVVCRTSNGKIKSAELLDLWEARQLYHRKINVSSSSVNEQVKNAFSSLSTLLYYQGRSRTEPTDSSGKILTNFLKPTADLFLQGSSEVVRLHGTKLNDTLDSNEPAVPSACQVEQIVNFMDSSTKPIVLVNQDILDKLSPTSQAALIVHEALYKYLRINNEENSVRTRRIVGYVFAGGKFPDVEKVLNGRYLSCSTATAPISSVDIFEKADGHLGLIQTNDRGQLMLGLYNAPADSEELLGQVFNHSLDFILSDKSCLHLPKEGSEDPYQFFSLPGQGPADFQRESLMAAQCVNGHALLQIGGAHRPAQDLKCVLVEAVASH